MPRRPGLRLGCVAGEKGLPGEGGRKQTGPGSRAAAAGGVAREWGAAGEEMRGTGCFRNFITASPGAGGEVLLHRREGGDRLGAAGSARRRWPGQDGLRPGTAAAGTGTERRSRPRSALPSTSGTLREQGR